MGLFCTTTSLQTVMIGTVFDTATTSLANKLITHAENEVNKWLSKRYDLSSFDTSTSVPPLVTSLAETLAEGYMYQRMSRGGKEGMAQGKALIDQALKNLESISKYELDLVGADGSVITDMSQTAYRLQSTTVNYKETFGEDDPLHWGVDDDKLSDLETDRE